MLTHPGFEVGEALPASSQAVVAMHVETILSEHAEHGRFALMGHSSGGLIAHQVAVELERPGVPPTRSC